MCLRTITQFPVWEAVSLKLGSKCEGAADTTVVCSPEFGASSRTLLSQSLTILYHPLEAPSPSHCLFRGHSCLLICPSTSLLRESTYCLDVWKPKCRHL